MSIVLTDLVKRFGTSLIVDRVSLEIADGELFVLLGASGSGKSTILRLIAGLLQPDSGAIVLHGKKVTWLPPQQRGVGFVFQNYSIFRHMSVAENVEFGLKIRRVSKIEAVQKREALLHLVGLGGLGNRYAHQLSGGQQQRVALARALAYEPDVLLLDEPFSALDVKIRAQLRRTLKQIQEQLNVTTILVTHDQEEAFELGNRIGVMERGRLLEIGTPETIYYRPQTVFAATFVGAGAVLMGQIKEGQACFGSLTLPIPDDVPYVEDLPVQVLIRPEAVQLSQVRPSATAAIMGQGKVHEHIFAGATRRVRLRLPRLPGTRQLAPSLPFGEENLLLDALLPSLQPLPTLNWWVSLTNWHILAQPNLQVMVHDYGRDSLSALHIAKQLQEAFHGQVTVTAVANTPEEALLLKQAVQKRLSALGLEGADIDLRTGSLAEQLMEAQIRHWYDFVLLPVDVPEGKLEEHVLHLLATSEVPILLVRGERFTLNHFLICTAVGEPGKQDVRVGGRLARRLQARVTLFHALTANSVPNPLIDAHLEQAVSTLRGLGVEAASLTQTAVTPAQAILAQAQASACDLIILGRHGPEPDSFLETTNIMQQVLLHVDGPVLVVPES